ncbi:PREDICTED: ubiquitin carboxyl-terminal hydrolase 47-like isoform X2 [Amphimedon queenslandica]|nr:PREDICTED: ubiquitin carboxyl-terminal hydrolase 47-like isoform X2 [Amphimedon queenslandica]|eukprot:XP_019860228.1 PREDICTED: ubiquitin carboxyl-terminal hydrolase 47-like isoform X2 [Amphimedon queenslandica]
MKRLDMTLVNVDSGSEFLVTRSRVSREVECKIKLYLLLVNNAEFCKFMMESIVVENTQVREFKKQIIEEAKVQGIDCVLELDKMRLRSKRGVYPGAIYLDQQMIRAEREIYVEPLKKPEMKNHHSQIQIYVIRWRPSQFSVDPVEEIILNNNNSKDVNEKLSELSGVPTEYIYCAESRLFPVEMSCFDIENKLEWHPSLFLSPFIIWNEGQVIYYKDNRETMKELTDKERSEIQEAERARLKKIGAYEF